MAHEVLNDLDTDNDRVHIVIMNRSQMNVQTPWHEIEHTLGRELRAIISTAGEALFQAAGTGVPVVIAQPNAIFSSQVLKLSEDLNTRIRMTAGGQIQP
jgi:hypothetical protein